MKRFVFGLMFLTMATSSFATIIRGTVLHYSGEHRPGLPWYYTALKTADGQRLELPRWIKDFELVRYKNNQVEFDGTIVKSNCSSEACATGWIDKINSAKFILSAPMSASQTFTGQIEQHIGVDPSGRRYKYIYIGADNVSVPQFIYGDLIDKNAFFTIVGKPMDMGPGHIFLLPLSSVFIQF